MPATMFESQCRTATPPLGYVAQLGQHFQVTLTATATRYIQFCPQRYCLVISANCKIRYQRKTKDSGYFIAPRQALNPSGYAIDFFKGKRLPEGMNGVMAAAWLKAERIDGSTTILEESIPMPFYDSVLTRQFIDKDINQYVISEDVQDAEQEASDPRWSWNHYPKR